MKLLEMVKDMKVKHIVSSPPPKKVRGGGALLREKFMGEECFTWGLKQIMPEGKKSFLEPSSGQVVTQS